MTTWTPPAPKNDHSDLHTAPYLPLDVLAVLLLIDQGYRYRRIAQLLNIPQHTVDNRTRIARNRFRTPFTQHAIRLAHHHHLLPQD